MRICMLGLILALLGLSGLRAEEFAFKFNLYDRFNESYLVPYAAPVAFGEPGLTADLTMNATIGGQTVRFQLDTGSRGIAVSRDLLPPNFPKGGRAGHVFYWSSGNRLNGHWIDTRVIFPDAREPRSGRPAAVTATLPILVVDTETCVAAPKGEVFPNHCADPGTTKTATAVTMMGIGFDRTGHGDVPNNNRWNQQFNPFLNLDAMKRGEVRAGYILTPQGVHLGLTTANTQKASTPGEPVSDFAYQKLLPTGLKQVPGSPPDWQAPTGSVRLNGQSYPVGQAVVDTGIDDLLLSLPGEPKSGVLTAGQLGVSLLDSDGRVGYGFGVSQASDPLTPASVTWSPIQPGRWSENRRSASFVNTGVRALNAFNFLYDGSGGYVGLQRNGLGAPGDVVHSPLISVQGPWSLEGGFATNLPILLQGNTEIFVPPVATQPVVLNGPISGPGGMTLKKGTVIMGCEARYQGLTVVDRGARLIYFKLPGGLKTRPGAVAIQTPGAEDPACVDPIRQH